MNPNLRNLMLEAGYAAPELATRAQNLAQLIVELCAEKVRGVLRDENSDLSCTAADQVQRALKELIND